MVTKEANEELPILWLQVQSVVKRILRTSGIHPCSLTPVICSIELCDISCSTDVSFSELIGSPDYLLTTDYLGNAGLIGL